jgi:hypothetical protein
MEWIIGTGENGFGALLRRDGYLFQAPLSYYSKAAHWDLSPGYQNGDLAFNRLIQPGCIYCHSGRPQPVPNFARASMRHCFYADISRLRKLSRPRLSAC